MRWERERERVGDWDNGKDGRREGHERYEDENEASLKDWMSADWRIFGFSISSEVDKVEIDLCANSREIFWKDATNKEMIEMNTFLKLFIQNSNVANYNPKIWYTKEDTS